MLLAFYQCFLYCIARNLLIHVTCCTCLCSCGINLFIHVYASNIIFLIKKNIRILFCIRKHKNSPLLIYKGMLLGIILFQQHVASKFMCPRNLNIFQMLLFRFLFFIIRFGFFIFCM